MFNFFYEVKNEFRNFQDNLTVFFQYLVTVALNDEKIKNDPQGITKMKPFINKCNWEGINFSSEKDDWKTTCLILNVRIRRS